MEFVCLVASVVAKATGMPEYLRSVQQKKVEHTLHAFGVEISQENHYTEALSYCLSRSLSKRRSSLDV